MREVSLITREWLISNTVLAVVVVAAVNLVMLVAAVMGVKISHRHRGTISSTSSTNRPETRGLVSLDNQEPLRLNLLLLLRKQHLLKDL
mmetsp:Transcript_34850/g.47066  ORF Transcript_34850/g.47066 Transcript_34850/m.47066 type:complete len:89 (-) Transcript_34850:596-862(-)